MRSRIPLYVWGAGGHGKVVADAAGRGRTFSVRGFLDDDARRRGQAWQGLAVVGGLEALAGLEPDAVVALGVGSNRARADLAARLLDHGRGLATVVHPAAVVAAGAHLGEGTYVGPMAVVEADARVGRGCIVNTAAIVEHDCRIEDWAHLAPRAALGGGASVGRGAQVGMGAVVLPGLRLGPWAVLGAGAVMVRSLPGSSTAVGVPAREIAGREP